MCVKLEEQLGAAAAKLGEPATEFNNREAEVASLRSELKSTAIKLTKVEKDVQAT